MNYEEFFAEHNVENQDDVELILSAASQDIYQHFGIKFGRKNPADGSIEWSTAMAGTAFIVFIDEIFKKLKSLQAEYSSYSINIADRLIIGFSNDDGEDMQMDGVDNEVVGNFCPYIQHINKKHKSPSFELSSDPQSRCTQWINSNILDDTKVIEAISSASKDTLKNIGIKLMHHEFIPPTFIMIYEELINVIQTKRRDEDKFQYEINFLNCFFIRCRETDDGDEIDIRPNIRYKLDMKDNEKASAKYEG